MSAQLISIWTVDGRLAIPFLCGQRQHRLLGSGKGESDLLCRGGLWLLLTTVEITQAPNEPFQQGSAEVTSQFGGLGLGLTIARAIVDAHGGELQARSAGLKRGSTFSVILPFCPK